MSVDHTTYTSRVPDTFLLMNKYINMQGCTCRPISERSILPFNKYSYRDHMQKIMLRTCLVAFFLGRHILELYNHADSQIITVSFSR